MIKPPVDAAEPAEALRQRAERVAQADAAADAAGAVLHELRVHQIELQMQNDELRRAQGAIDAARARYVDLYDLAPVGYLTLSEKGVIIEANLTVAALLGVARGALLAQPVTAFVARDEQDRYYLFRKRVLASAGSEVVELRLLHREGGEFWARLEANRDARPDGGVALRVIVTDVTARRAADVRLRQAAAMFESACEGVMVTDASQVIQLVNGAFTQLTGYSAEEAIGQHPRMLKSGRHPRTFFETMWAQIDGAGHWQGEIWNRRKSGELYPELLSVTAVRDEVGRTTHYVGVFSDISQIKDAAARFDFLAHHDTLTGLPNRLTLLDRLRHSLLAAERDGHTLALLMLDLDRFKDVNDSFGHAAGDELLVQVARRFTDRLRSIDTLARLGGDEFAVMLDVVARPADAGRVAADLIAVLAAPLHLAESVEAHVGVSVGISLYPAHGKTADELLQQADAALYRAKGEGRGQYRFFSDDLTLAARERVSLESRFRRALAGEELRVHYQAQVDVVSGRIVGAEALTRWHHPTDGTISPGVFIPAAEESGLIGELGRWVLREVCLAGRRWLDAGLRPVRLAVNVSPRQFRHGDICATVAEVLRETGYPAAWLELELTEGALMQRESDAVSTLQRLRALGVRLAIDDFGTGYSSLAYLKRFPLDVLKIDKGFVDDVPEQEDDRQIVTAIIALAHSLRLDVLAEGVERPEQLAFLASLGCDLYQGYLMSPAVPGDEFAALLRA